MISGSKGQLMGSKWLSEKLFLTVLILLIPSYLRGTPNVNHSGYFKNFFTALDQPTADSTVITGSVYHRIRYQCLVSFNHLVQFNLAYSLAAVVATRDQHRLISEQTGDYRYQDLSSRIYPGDQDEIENFALYQDVDRAFMKIRFNLGDVYIGRQPFSWGISRNYSPTDFISPFSLNQLDQEQRRGSDGVRVKIPVGMMNELDFGWVAGSEAQSDLNAYFTRMRINIAKTDFEFIGAYFRKNLLIGVGFTRSIFQAGFWSEGAYLIPDAHENIDQFYKNGFFKFSAGMDYSWWGTLYGFVEYDYNGGGKSCPEQYYLSQQRSASSQLGKHYLGGGLNYQFKPLVNISGNLILNLNDQSVFITPRLEYNIAENIYLYFGSYSGIGSKPDQMGMKSEFGSYPRIYYSSFSVYF
ncbi:MAG: hypothetical protein APR63_02080 [Desulfuromonas sp. SDB]|nr:MAG: hypothetical protein APR63_02080 [Desulfuromonas sp. SDB]